MMLGMACMAGVAVKFQVFRTSSGQDGTENCDYTGDRAPLLTKEQGDNHRTIPDSIPFFKEVDPASDEMIADVQAGGPILNRMFKRQYDKEPHEAAALASGLGLEGEGPVGLRVVLMDH
jgi:hypothetical protein